MKIAGTSIGGILRVQLIIRLKSKKENALTGINTALKERSDQKDDRA